MSIEGTLEDSENTVASSLGREMASSVRTLALWACSEHLVDLRGGNKQIWFPAVAERENDSCASGVVLSSTCFLFFSFSSLLCHFDACWCGFPHALGTWVQFYICSSESWDSLWSNPSWEKVDILLTKGFNIQNCLEKWWGNGGRGTQAKYPCEKEDPSSLEYMPGVLDQITSGQTPSFFAFLQYQSAAYFSF